MKITLNVDCSPVEARAFFGLPDVQPINDMITEAMLARTKENIDSLSDPTVFWERAISAGGSSMEAMQRLFAAALNTKEGGGKS